MVFSRVSSLWIVHVRCTLLYVLFLLQRLLLLRGCGGGLAAMVAYKVDMASSGPKDDGSKSWEDGGGDGGRSKGRSSNNK